MYVATAREKLACSDMQSEEIAAQKPVLISEG